MCIYICLYIYLNFTYTMYIYMNFILYMCIYYFSEGSQTFEEINSCAFLSSGSSLSLLSPEEVFLLPIFSGSSQSFCTMAGDCNRIKNAATH